MKFFPTAAVATTLFTVEAFVPQPISGHGRLTALNVERGDSASAVEAALEASRTFGPTSPEARVAWDIVEEINASDNSAAYKGKKNDALSDPAKNKEMYEQFLELQKLGNLQRSHVEEVKHVTQQIRAVKLAPPAKSESELSSRLHNPILDHALMEAKLMTEKHGIQSSEAKLAWEAVEHIASDDFSEAIKGGLTDEECLIEMVEACEAMDELNRALFLNQQKESGRYQG